jgi:hypothetical protein
MEGIKPWSFGGIFEHLVIKGSEIYFGRKGIVYVINKQIMAYAFGVCQTRYIEDPKGQMNKMVVEELLFNHDIKPLYTMQISGMFKKIKCHITSNTQQ